jgi:hypothetical protein
MGEWRYSSAIRNLGTKCQSHSPADIPSGKSPFTHYVGGQFGPRAGLNVVYRRTLVPVGM